MNKDTIKSREISAEELELRRKLKRKGSYISKNCSRIKKKTNQKSALTTKIKELESRKRKKISNNVLARKEKRRMLLEWLQKFQLSNCV